MEVTSELDAGDGRKFMHRVVAMVLVLVAAWLGFATSGLSGYPPVFGGYAGFSVMAQIANETSWSFYFSGLTAFTGLCLAFPDWRIRMFGAATLCANFLTLACLVTLGRPYGTGTGPYLGLAALSAALAYNEAFLAQADRKHVEPRVAVADPP